MAQNKIQKFRDIDEASLYLNGMLKGSQSMRSYSTNARTNLIPTIPGIVGKTLKFLLPTAHEITFVAGATTLDDKTSLNFADFKAQVEAAFGGPPTGSSSLIVRSFDAFIAFIETNPANGVQITTPTAGEPFDARPLLGYTVETDSISKVYKPAQVSNVPPCWVWADTNGENNVTIYVWE